MEFKDYYSIMGVEPSSSPDEIKRAYRKLARKYHPDVSKAADAETKFKEVGEAYEVLKDPKKRAAYDQLRTRGWQGGEQFTPPPGWEFHRGPREHSRFSETNAQHFSDFFEALFGGRPFARGWQRRTEEPIPMRGEDIRTSMPIFLEEAYQGATKTIQLNIPTVTQAGQIRDIPRTLNIKIPKGVTEGQQIRLKGQGGVGHAGAPNGDLFIDVRFAPHPFYFVEGKNVVLNLPVSPWEAALGSKIKVPTLAGPVELTIPPSSQTGTKLRLKGRGLPPLGDQYVILQVVLPPADSEDLKKLYREMGTKVGQTFNPRQKLGV